MTIRACLTILLAVAPATLAVPGWGQDAQAQPAPRVSLMVPAAFDDVGPDVYRVRFETSVGDFVIEVQRDWAPYGADRFYNLVRNGYYDGCRFFRVVKGFMVQFGIHGNPTIAAVWKDANMPPDRPSQHNLRGFISYAMGRTPDTRTTQVFINFGDNSRLDSLGFAPFGSVVEGMEVVDSIYSGYGEGAPRGRGPSQARIQAEGNEYLTAEFPEMDYIIKATIEP